MDSRKPVEDPAERPIDGPIDTNPEHGTAIGRRDNAQKEQGGPKDRQAEQERISRDESLHRGGFPVAGHGEPEPERER